MKAPEKIYVPTAGDKLHYHMACPNNEFQESIEYIRTDAFIEKACEWLKEHWREYVWLTDNDIIHFGHYENDFKQAMEK